MSIPVTVARPEGAGPFPAVVMLHDCSGLGPRSSGAPGRWTGTLVARGYVVITPDSFATRGYPNGVCTESTLKRGGPRVTPNERAQDAADALAYAKTLPYVDARHIAVMGGSHGGTTTLLALTYTEGFAAGIALYPRCSTAARDYMPLAPLLILVGELDDWTPAADCRRLAAEPRITLKIYPGAHHSFDNPRPVRFVAERLNPSAPGGRGATTGGNPDAWKDAIGQVTAFLDRHLR